MTTMVYTQVEYEWDGVAETYVVKAKQGYEYDGPVVLMKKKFKGILGTVLKVVATVALAAVLGPAALGMSAWAAGATAGALVGGATGGWQGALTGGIMGGIGGYVFGGGGDVGLGGPSNGLGMTDGSALTADVGGIASSQTAGLAPSVGVEAGSAVTGGAGDFAGGALDAAAASVPGPTSYGFDPWAAPDAGSFADAAVSPSGVTNWEQGVSGQGGSASPVAPQSAGTMNGFDAQELSPSHAMAGPQSDTGFLSSIDWKGAGLNLGSQVLGSAIAPEGPDMGAYNDYLKAQTKAAGDTTAYNINNMNKKAAIGDQLAGDAYAMNPDTMGEQYRRNTQNQMEAAWLDQEGRMAGLNPRAVESARRQSQLNSSLAQGSSYVQGQNAGLQQRLSTYGTAGSMYSQVQAPGDTMGASYLNANSNARQTANSIGGAIEQAFQPVTNNTTTGTQKTRDQDVRYA